MSELVQVIVSGVAAGAVYALIAMGFSLIYQTSGILNLAFGEYVMLGSLVAFTFISTIGLPIALSLLAVIIVGALASLGLDVVVFRVVRRVNGEMGALIASVGLLILLKQVGVIGWGTTQLIYKSQIAPGSALIDGVTINGTSVATVAVALVLVAAVQLFLRKTRWGITMRAAAGDAVMAELMGVRRSVAQSLSALIAGGLAGISGVLLGSEFFASYNLDSVAILGLVAATLGGFGNINGALLGGLAVGLVESVTSSYWSGSYSSAVCYGLLVAVLLIRPQGVFGRALRSA